MILKNICLILILLSLLFILAQQELIYIVFSLLLFILFSLGWITFYFVEFLILILFIIYVGVIVVLFLFTVLMYNLPKVELTIDIIGLIIVITSLFCFFYESQSNDIIYVYSTIDILLFIFFINEHFSTIILCGLLLLISIITALLIVNTLHSNVT